MTLLGDASSRLRSYSNNDALLPVRREVGKVTLWKEPRVYVGDYSVLFGSNLLVAVVLHISRHHFYFGMDSK